MTIQNESKKTIEINKISIDKIYIDELTVFTKIGVYDWEQSILQKITLDLEIAWENTRAAQTDNVDDCLNYAEVAKTILNFLQNNHYQLIESVAEQTAQHLFEKFPIDWLKIKVSKPDAVAQAKNVAIEITRQRNVFF